MDKLERDKRATYAPRGLEYAAVDQSDAWLLRFADQDCGDQWFGGAGYTAEETRALAIDAWSRYAPAWSVRLMRTVTLDEVRALSQPTDSSPAGEVVRLREARLEAIGKFVDAYLSPWGAWKTAWWEGEVSDDAAFSDRNALRHVANLARAPLTDQTAGEALRTEGGE